MGRPIKKERRDQQLNLSLSTAELDSIRRRAEALGMRPAPFGRAVLLAAKDECKLETQPQGAAPDIALTRLIYNHLGRLGNNLNQLVRHLHRTGDPLPRDLEPLLADIRSILRRVPE